MYSAGNDLYDHIGHGKVHNWGPILIDRLEHLWQTRRTQNDYIDFLTKYGVIWFGQLYAEEIHMLLL